MRQMKSKNGVKKTMAILVGLLMLVNSLPLQLSKVYAFDQALFRVDSVTVFKIYDANRNLEQRRILIIGAYLKDATVGIVTSSGYEELENRSVNSEGLLQFDIDEDQLGNSVMIEGISIPIDEGEMPTLTGVNRKVRIETTVPADWDDLLLQGTKLTKVNDTPDAINAYYEHDGAYTPMDDTRFTNDANVTIPDPSGTLGYQNIVFDKNTTVVKTFNAANTNVNVTVTVKYTYKDQFRFVKDLIVDDLEMRPNRGEKGETVYFEAPTPNLDNYDVFFLKKLDDPYTSSNKGTNKSFQQNISGKDILSVQVPDLAVGEYYVVLTNPVTEGNDPMKEVVQELVVGTAPDYEKFSIIDGNIKSKIINVQPSTGPDTGTKTTITGQFFVTLNIPEFIVSDPNLVTVEDPNAPPAGDPDTKTLIVNYTGGTYNGIAIDSAQRRIKIFIGGEAVFLTNSSGNAYDVIYSSDLDKIVVKTPQITDAETNPKKDVVVETETILTKNSAAGGGTIVIKERAELKDGYTYIPSKVTPEITDATPNMIQVTGNPGSYEIPEDIVVAIHGKNFMIHKLVNTDGSSEIRYPIIEFGTDIGLNKNSNQNTGDPPSDPTLDIKVFDAAGKELDGTSGNEIGTKILVKIPAGKTVEELGKTFIKVTNPVRNSTSSGLSALKADGVEFVNPDVNKNPIITSVTPNVVTVDGGEKITVDGSNFAQGVKVFLDGEEVKSITRQEDGKKITFTCPKGREGETQLQVMNPEGGIAMWPFIFVETYTNPKITDFSPKSGNTGTLVIVTGDNFLKPEPTATEDNIYKLIGSRVLLEGDEINIYNIDPTTKKIKLRDYTAPAGNRLFEIGTDDSGGNFLKVADYYHAVLLEDEDGHYYTVDVDATGQVTLSNGAGTNYTIEMNDDGTGFQADLEGGSNVSMNVDTTGITLDPGGVDELRLNLKTLYKVESINGVDTITGSRVRVVDRNHIYFTVPILEADGYYDVTVVNPDTKKDSKVDQQGFYYYSQPQSRPEITDIQPDEGSVEGGYTITIYGEDFEDNGSTKSKVFINGVEVEKEDTVVSIDGTSITVKVPEYPGDLMEDWGTSRLTVPVVVVNPDGGSASEESGFTYVVPGSHPQITKIVPQKGSAAGGDVVEITGTDFRYYEPYDDADRDQTRDNDETFNDLNGNDTWDSEEDMMNPNSSVREPEELENHPVYTQYFKSPILPKVYFGKNQAKIVEFSEGYLKVVIPAGTAGKTDVYLTNNDSGISNTVSFEYVASSPKITSILPSQGKKQGKDRVEIMGSDFLESSMEVYGVNNGNQVIQTVNMPLVRFGSISNRSIPREQENSGRIDNSRTTVKLTGGLTIAYNGNDDSLTVSVEDRGTFSTVITGYDGSIKYIPVAMLKNSQGVTYTGYELIRVEISDRRLLVDRGYSPEAEYINSGQLSVLTPSYYTVGAVTMTVTNPDGGTATGQFEYKNPASDPSIINVTKENQSPAAETIDGRDVKVLRMSYKGGSIVSIIGEDFREDAQILISDVVTIQPADITYNLPNRLTFEMPAVPESAVGKLCRVIVLNEDGASAASDELNPPIYILFTKGETSPSIEKVIPDTGSSIGGDRIKIEGKDFRETMEGYDGRIAVYFGENKVPDSDVTVVDYKTIYVITPSNVPGKVKVRVENPDGEISDPEGEYTYLSSPKIIAVVDSQDPDENTLITVISVEGGQEIKLKGSGFMDGAEVIFNPVLEKVDDTSSVQGTVIYVEGQAYTLESGTPGTNVKFIDSETLTVTTPPGKIDTGGVIVINSDGGATEIYIDLTYGLPELSAPTDVVAELVYDRYIKVNWKGVTGAKEYEIFIVVDDNETELIGSTELSSFVYSDLEPDTRYKFIVKAVGDFGSSKPSMTSNSVKTGSKVGPPDDDGSLGEKTGMEKSGDTANVVIGTDDYDDKAIVIDLTKGTLAGSKEVVVSMPAAVVTGKNAKDITIVGKDFKIKFNPGVFSISSMRDNKSKEDAGVRFKVSPSAGGSDLGTGEGTPLSAQYVLEATVFIGKDSTKMENLSSKIEITLDFNSSLAELRRLEKLSLDWYDGYSRKWTAAGYGNSGDTAITVPADKLGRFMVIGRRR